MLHSSGDLTVGDSTTMLDALGHVLTAVPKPDDLPEFTVGRK